MANNTENKRRKKNLTYYHSESDNNLYTPIILRLNIYKLTKAPKTGGYNAHRGETLMGKYKPATFCRLGVIFKKDL